MNPTSPQQDVVVVPSPEPVAAPSVASTDPHRPGPQVLRTRKQLQAAAINEQALVRAAWKRQLPVAQLKWPRIDAVELSQARGNVHRLAGLVQMRYQVSREMADQQVKEFFATAA
ncbi:MAG: hypothetical protein ACREUE_08000 [Panacagrimonas sp.]